MTRFDLLHEFAEINKLDYNRLCALVNTSVAPSEPAAQQAIDALEAAKNGLEWYRDARPMLTDGSDDEMDAQIDAAVLALRATIPDEKAPSDTLAKQHAAIRKVFKHHGLADPHTAVVADIIAIISETA